MRRSPLDARMVDPTWATLNPDLLVIVAAKSGSATAVYPMLTVNTHWQAALSAGGDALWKELALARFPRLRRLLAMGPSTLAGATRRLGWSNQSISALSTANVPVNRMKVMNRLSFSPTH